MLNTKDRILEAAVQLFSDRGYDSVSMRDIANLVGIKAPSIYNHFGSKQELLYTIFDFYIEQQRVYSPDLADLLLQAESAPIEELLLHLDYRYPPALRETMNRILVIAGQRLNNDLINDDFLRECFFQHHSELLWPLLERLIELERIQPIEIGAIVSLLAYNAYGVAVLNRSTLELEMSQWQDSMNMVVSLLKKAPEQPGPK
jgi:AcrR family transcriptional regulator